MILSLSKDTVQVLKEQDVVFLKNRVKEVAVRIKMGLVNQTRLLTAASELVRNMMRYANGGVCQIEVVSSGRNNGVRLVFSDKGPGIPDIEAAMRDGFSTGKSLGLGLPGTKRLVNEFEIKSKVGEGTTVTIIKWANG
ncbi:serine/threonine-protein kinase RsbT [Mucilaginibacter gossypiicola]|uniref:Anti-sigma regulatory factor n=2 Tax=Mucilaginibacter TaxID=423349 RepID=A0A5C1I3I9_9SPHI|nr:MULTISPECIES: anti-sigma regulatory factor [Mucilaginibacter]QEM12436.1 anti-sigma regulatory factor [Mucilaginibacter rubeus]UOE48756.1 anti-sigma regulatory factor [Mucilaginibacter sp. SMC90]SEO98982.1 serine/threonine-protein kinase RsbT [Mucilaginibacter gossypiicola]